MNTKFLNKKIFPLLTILFVFFTACEKDITVDLPKADEKIVVEGFIEYNDYSVVFLTKNASYFDPVDTNVVNNSIIKENQATVIVENNGIYDTLQPTIFDRWPHYGYKGTKIKGQENAAYSLKILWNNHEYNAQTIIPEVIPIDSIKFNKFDFSDSLGFLDVFWKDPAFIGNYYAITVKDHKNQNWFYRPFLGIHILDDKLDNNDTVVFSPLLRGYERNDYYNDYWDEDEDIEYINFLSFHIGDTISVKLSTMDEESFLFWSSWYRSLVTAGNPFANPASIKSNIDGDPANGYWIGYGSHITKLYIKDSVTIEYLE